ncbi:MAG TPA: glycosyltransferase [Bryobacterales bacterium]|nr:glycosyltransferase [Bryobacterales bacterium]
MSAPASGTRPTLSVIVASYNSPATLEKCLESLTAQLGPADELIVADCSDQDPRLAFQREFQNVHYLNFSKRLTIPELRREAIKISRGEILLLTEGRVVPSSRWAAILAEAHVTHPQAPAVGGPIDFTPTSAFDSAVFFCEYGRHMPPVPDGPCEELSGANLSYKRWALDLCCDLIDAGAWEPFLHRRLEQHGYSLWRASQASVCYHNSLFFNWFFRQRFHYGRWFAAARVAGAGRLRRLVYAAFCPLLPGLLTWRLGRAVFGRGRHRAAFLRALPLILIFHATWSVGELCGYLAGAGASNRQIF